MGSVSAGLAGAANYWNRSDAAVTTPRSAIALQEVLPHRYSFSEAYAITSRGMIFGFASGRGRKHVVAVEWLPVKTHPSERK
jgi:hypothetical protein